MKNMTFIRFLIGIFVFFFVGYITFNLLTLINKENQPFIFRVQHIDPHKIKVNGYAVRLVDNRLYALTMNTLYPTRIQIEDQTKYITIPQLTKDTYIPITIKTKNNQQTFHLYTLPYDFPIVWAEQHQKHSDNGYILTSLHGLKLLNPSYAMILKTNGELVWYRGNEQIDMSTFHLQQHRLKNKVRYSMHIQTDRLSSSFIRGKHLLMNEKFDVIDEIQVLPTHRHPQMPADEHEFVYIDDNHYIVLGYYLKKSFIPIYNKTVSYVSVIIQEQKNGNVIFEWMSDDYLKTFSSCFERCVGHNVPDYIHINSVFIDPKDNHLIVSSASGDYILKIHRKTGQVLWHLGGNNSDFSLKKEHVFIRQHDVQMLHNNWLMMFDNGIGQMPTPQRKALFHASRILQLQLDEKQKQILAFKEIPVNEDIAYMGSSHTMPNGGMLVGCGSSTQCFAKRLNNKFDVLYQLKTKSPYFSYRSYYVDKLN